MAGKKGLPSAEGGAPIRRGVVGGTGEVGFIRGERKADKRVAAAAGRKEERAGEGDWRGVGVMEGGDDWEESWVRSRASSSS